MTAPPARRRWRDRRAPNRVWLYLRRLGRRTRRSFTRRMEKARSTPERVGIDEPWHWWPRPWAMVRWALVIAGALFLLLWVAMGITAVLNRGENFLGFSLDSGCTGIGLSCGALVGIVVPWLSLAFGTAVFLIYRLWWVTRGRKKIAKSTPYDLVPTAGAVSGQVVGRDELCKVLVESVHDRKGRRPQLIVGGVGTGKTAVMVELTQLLAEYRATPVAIRMRDVEPGFVFSDLASKEFQGQIHRRLRSSAEGDRAWRYLRHDDRVVVLADGLEEALSEDKDRDDHIRLAIARAKEDCLPLVIASRPHDSLRGMDASVLELEPMSEEAALQYLGSGDVQGDPRRVDWIVETAGVAEAPLYLRIAHELNKERMLSHLVSEDDEPGGVNTRDLDRSALRRNLLDTWRSALVRGRLHGSLPLTLAQRQATMTLVAALACIGLQKDRLEIKYDDALLPRGTARTGLGSAADRRRWWTYAGPRDNDEPGERHWLTEEFTVLGLTDWVRHSLPGWEDLRGEVNTRLAASWAAQLGMVEVRGEAVRFQHSVLQAYLGSLPLESLLKNPTTGQAFLDEAFNGPDRPARELLIALVLLSRHSAAQRLSRGASAALAADSREPAGAADLVRMLQEKAKDHVDGKALDILAAALEIDAVVAPEHRRQEELARIAADRWLTFRAADLRTLEEAKLGFVARCGEALREVDRRARRADTKEEADRQRVEVQRAYRELFAIGHKEPSSYPVRHAVAQELGSGGPTAFRALAPEFKKALASLDSGTWQKGEEDWHKVVLSAWLAPLLFGTGQGEPGTAESGRTDFSPRENLAAWIGRVGRPEVRRHLSGQNRREHPADGQATARRAALRASAEAGSPPDDGSGAENQWPAAAWQAVPALPISVEVALAQGFKWAANRRERHPRAHAEGRTYLAEQALDLVKRSGFWFSQLTLLQALGLWALPEDSESRGGDRVPGPSSPGVYPPDVRARVRHWVDVAGSLRDEGREPRDQGSAPRTHRFVVEAGELIIHALRQSRPERFMWIDEHGVTSKIGASAINRAELRKHHLWIPPSIGWSALDRRAQQLVADVLLLVNLADRGEDAVSREDRLNRANRRDLPPCLTKDRDPLDPNRKIGVAEGSQPGKNCPGECEFDLCPYPPKGHVNYHAELTETFCRRQQTLLRRGLRNKSGPWQATLKRDLRKFWEEMARRARR